MVNKGPKFGRIVFNRDQHWVQPDQVQREIDREARLVIAEELGHGRPQVTTAYLGK